MTVPIDWIPADWPAPRGIVAGSTTRAGGVSSGVYESLNLGAHVGDATGNVSENRRRFVDELKLPAEPVWLSQVHGTHVIVDPNPGQQIPADGVVTRKSNTVCTVMTADCLPILLVSENGDELAAAHAGWRGLCAGVIEATLNAFQAPRARILVWFGPAISQSNFEVGNEVRQAFVDHHPLAAEHFVRNERGRWQADLYGLARQRFAMAGVQQVFGGDHCTFGDPTRFFSYRRDGQCGRMANFVFRYGDSA